MDRTDLLALPVVSKRYAAGEPIIENEDGAAHSFGTVVNGFVTCFKVVGAKHRHIVAFAIPGDSIDLPSLLLGRPAAHVEAQQPTEIVWIAHRDILVLCDARPAIARALWLESLIESGISREWAANIGQRRAPWRIAHLLLELHERLTSIGLADGPSFVLPLKQSVIAAAVGLSLVHCNKSFQALKRSTLVHFDGQRRIVFPDIDRLKREVGFDASYLHIGHRFTA